MERDRPELEGMEPARDVRAPDEVTVEGDPADDDRFGDDRNMRDPGAIRAEDTEPYPRSSTSRGCSRSPRWWWSWR
jgi:hypothetical protein